MKCRLCGGRLYPWQSKENVGNAPVHYNCYSVTMHILQVGYTVLTPKLYLERIRHLVQHAWNTYGWRSNNWARGSLLIDEGVEKIIGDNDDVQIKEVSSRRIRTGDKDLELRLEEDVTAGENSEDTHGPGTQGAGN